MLNPSDRIRRIILRPYRKGCGPVFTLDIFYNGFDYTRGRKRVAYVLRQSGEHEPIFEGSDYYPSSLHAIDSDASVAGLLSFLALKPGDTDREYFDSYTPRQLNFAHNHAEAVSKAAIGRFGE